MKKKITFSVSVRKTIFTKLSSCLIYLLEKLIFSLEKKRKEKEKLFLNEERKRFMKRL